MTIQGKSRFFFCFLICLFLVVSESGCGESVIRPDSPLSSTVSKTENSAQPDPLDQARKVVDCLQRDDTQQLLTLIYPRAIQRYGREQIIQRNARVHQDLGITSILFSGLEPLSSEDPTRQAYYGATVRYESRYGSFDKDITFSLIWHPDAQSWQLQWTPALIFPGLSEVGEVQTEVLKAKRGDIIDCKGKTLAQDGNLVEISVVPGRIQSEDYPEIEKLLSLEPGTILEKLSKSWVRTDTVVPLTLRKDLKGLDYRQMQSFSLITQEKTTRLYPFGELTAALIGYVTPPTAEDLERIGDQASEVDFVGKSGLEEIYDQRLRGKNGVRVYLTGSYEKTLFEEPAQDGETIQLTLDAEIQSQVARNLHHVSGQATVIDTQTGEIRALVSTPSYDPSLFVHGISQLDYQELIQNPQAPLQAKFAQAYTPGSTQKVLTAMAALDQKVVDLEETLEIEGKTWQYSPFWGNYEVTRFLEHNGETTLTDALTRSDNIFFAQMALRLGAEGFRQGMAQLGLGEPVCPSYPFPAAQLTNPNQSLEDGSVLLADSGYGQGELLYSPVQLAAIYASLWNGGYVYTPLLEKTSSISAEPPKQIHLSKDQIDSLREALAAVPEQQYPKQMIREGLRLAGKSGTAERGLNPEGEMQLNSWFIGVEADRPTLCLSLLLIDSHQLPEFEAMKRFADCMEALYVKPLNGRSAPLKPILSPVSPGTPDDQLFPSR